MKLQYCLLLAFAVRHKCYPSADNISDYLLFQPLVNKYNDKFLVKIPLYLAMDTFKNVLCLLLRHINRIQQQKGFSAWLGQKKRLCTFTSQFENSRTQRSFWHLHLGFKGNWESYTRLRCVFRVDLHSRCHLSSLFLDRL